MVPPQKNTRCMNVIALSNTIETRINQSTRRWTKYAPSIVGAVMDGFKI